MRLANKTAIVTGGARGIGAAITQRFCAEGASVLIADLRADEATAEAAAVRDSGGRCEFIAADVATEMGWQAIIEACERHFGVPHVLVNNAGVNRYQRLVEETLEGWRYVLEANLTSVFLGMRAVIPRMAAGGGGAIVNVSSTWGLVAADQRPPTTPARAASRCSPRTQRSPTPPNAFASTRSIPAPSPLQCSKA